MIVRKFLCVLNMIIGIMFIVKNPLVQGWMFGSVIFVCALGSYHLKRGAL